MYYIVQTGKTFIQASADLEAAVLRHGFGVLHVHDLGATLRSKSITSHLQKSARCLRFAIQRRRPKFYRSICG